MSRRPFDFALTPVLDLRARAVETARAALAEAVRARSAAEDAVAQADAQLAESLVVPEVRTARHLGGAALHQTSLAQAADAARQALARAVADERAARRTLAKVMCDHQALLSLHHAAADTHRVRALRAEAAVLDDLALAGRATSPSL